MGIDCKRILRLQSIRIVHVQESQPSDDIVEVYLYGSAPEIKGGGVETIESVDRVELRFKCPRSLVRDLDDDGFFEMTLKDPNGKI